MTKRWLAWRGSFCILVLTVVAALVWGCTSNRQANLDIIYTPAASYHGPDRNPIVVIPGAMGTSLVDGVSGALVWGAFDGRGVDVNAAAGARLLALPLTAEGKDDVQPTTVLERVRLRLLGIPMQLEVYARILATLGAAGFRDEDLGTAGEVDYGDEHFTCFQFAYDWRRDNAENAARLLAFLTEKRAYVAEQYTLRYGIDRPDIKFDIVAHSMGGLLTRYFLRYGGQQLPADGTLPELNWAGAQFVERAVLIATPNGGSLDAFQALVEGRRIAPTLPRYQAAIIGSFPSSYQLLPRARHGALVRQGDDTSEGAAATVLDPFDPHLWQQYGWGLADDDQADVLQMLMPEVADPNTRRERALAAQRRVLQRAKTFTMALDVEAVAPAGLDLLLVAGDAIDTARRMTVDRQGNLELDEHAPGDGTVLRSSVLLDERVGGQWGPTLQTPIDYENIMLLPESHLGITKNGAFRDNMLFWLLEEPR